MMIAFDSHQRYSCFTDTNIFVNLLIGIGPSRRVNVGRSTSMTGHDLCKDRVIGLKNELRAVKRDLEKVTAQLHETEAQRDAFKKND